jgi:hypothetical protein
MNTADVVARILRANLVAQFWYFEAKPQLPLQQGLNLTSRQKRLVAGALRLRANVGLPFLEALILRMLASSPDDQLLAAANRHYVYRLRPQRISSVAGYVALLRKISTPGDPESMRVLASRVTTRRGEARHVPMLDFRFIPSSRNQRLIASVLKALDAPGGYLLSSGGSYHYYGSTLLTSRGLTSFLSRSLLYSPIVDKAWVAHQLIQGYCGLRISTKPGRPEPRLVARV